MSQETFGRITRITLVLTVLATLCVATMAAQERKFGRQSAFKRCWLVTKDLGQPLDLDFIRSGGNQCWRDFNRDYPNG